MVVGPYDKGSYMGIWRAVAGGIIVSLELRLRNGRGWAPTGPLLNADCEFLVSAEAMETIEREGIVLLSYQPPREVRAARGELVDEFRIRAVDRPAASMAMPMRILFNRSILLGPDG